MLLAIDVMKVIYTSVFLIVFVISYFVVLQSNFERLFKQGQIWAIRIGQVLLALAISYLVTAGIMGLVNSTQFTN